MMDPNDVLGHRFQLGSVAAISDDAGTVIELLAFDHSGKRRFGAATFHVLNRPLAQ